MAGAIELMTLAAVLAMGRKPGASVDDIKNSLPAVMNNVAELESELAKLEYRPQLYQKLEIDLSIARDKEREDISGDFLVIESIDGDLDVKFNEKTNAAINVYKNRKIITPFDTLYLTNTAQSGKSAVIWIGKGKSFVIDTASKAFYGGEVYVNSDIATADTARRFETSSKKLKDIIIIVKTHDQLFGDSSGQTYPVGAGETFGITQIDISTLYFKNATAGQNGVVHILAVEN